MQRFMNNLSRFMAILGGIVLTALIILVCVSVLGRTLNGFLHSAPVVAVLGDFAKTLLDAGVGPILGDFELVEAGVAFAIFAFIPFCQITGGHATVDIFTSALPLKVNRLLQMVIDIVFAGVLILIALQLYEGMLSCNSTRACCPRCNIAKPRSCCSSPSGGPTRQALSLRSCPPSSASISQSSAWASFSATVQSCPSGEQTIDQS